VYITLKQFAEKYEWPTLCGLRSIYFDATKDKNDFLPAFRKIGRRLLVCPEVFFNIVGEHASQNYS